MDAKLVLRIWSCITWGSGGFIWWSNPLSPTLNAECQAGRQLVFGITRLEMERRTCRSQGGPSTTCENLNDLWPSCRFRTVALAGKRSDWTTKSGTERTLKWKTNSKKKIRVEVFWEKEKMQSTQPARSQSCCTFTGEWGANVMDKHQQALRKVGDGLTVTSSVTGGGLEASGQVV